MTRRFALALTLAAPLALAASGCGARHSPPASSAPEATLLGPRDVAAARRTDLAEGVPVAGTLEPDVDVVVTTPYPALVEAVVVREGQHVRHGQVLARLRAHTQGPDAANAAAQHRIAAADLARMRNLFKEGAIAQRDLDDAEARLKSAEAALAAARERLNDAIVRSPVDGTVAKRHVQGGDRVGDGDPMFRIVDTHALELQATVPADVIGRIHPGAPVRLAVSGGPDSAIAGIVARINATADPATRQVRLYARVDNPDGRLVGELHVSGVVVLDARRAVVAVPSAAVRRDTQGGTLVWVIAGGRATPRRVALGLHDEPQDLIEVTRGLAPGDTAIVGPVEGLVSGQPIQIAGRES